MIKLTSGVASLQCIANAFGRACPGALRAGLSSSSNSLGRASISANVGGAGGRNTTTRQVTESDPCGFSATQV